MAAWSYYTVEITSASVSDLLTMIHKRGFRLQNIRFIDDLRICADITSSDYPRLYQLTDSRGDSLKIIKSHGTYFIIQKTLRRPVLIIGCLLWLFLAMYLPARVLFIYVEGNSTVDSTRIIEAAERSGICFGASRRHVRSEKVKNKLLSEIDTLQWAGVNTYGCVAVISVKERVLPQDDQHARMFSSIIAAHDGIISQITVTSGNTLCKVGQAVRKGQILVSGYTDCGLSIRAESANAEIMALTNRHVTAISPVTSTKRVVENEREVQYSIQIGKNIIKLHKDSRIPDTKCVKIYTQKYLTLPGGFQLPVALITEKISRYDEQQISLSDADGFTWMKDAAASYLLTDMVAGNILSECVDLKLDDELCRLNGSYACQELIGQVRTEKIGEHNG